MRSNPTQCMFFILQLENILRSYFNFSPSYGRLTDSKSLLGLLLVSFIWLGEKMHPMPRRCRLRSCPDWLRTQNYLRVFFCMRLKTHDASRLLIFAILYLKSVENSHTSPNSRTS